MAVVKPFKAWRPKPELAKEVACVPYDVINVEEARELAQGKERSFLHVIRPEIDLDPDISTYDVRVYEKGRDNLKALLESEAVLQDQEECLYIYRLIMNGRSQSGIFGCVSVDDYKNEVILKHELTRPAKEDDRTKHIISQKAHAEPVMLTFRDPGTLTELIQQHIGANEPLYDLLADDGIRHTIWKVTDTREYESSFDQIPKLYVADGHHRCASAARAAYEFRSQKPSHQVPEDYDFFPAVLFPMNEMEILAYNRIVYTIPDDLLEQLRGAYELKEDASPTPSQKGQISLYLNDRWYGLSLKDSGSDDPVSHLDISLLQDQILEPMLGISDQRTDPNIDFVGGIRGTKELEKRVDQGEAALGISLYPTSIEELLEVSDAHMLMPPKSTWFEPKLRSGLLIHTF